MPRSCTNDWPSQKRLNYINIVLILLLIPQTPFHNQAKTKLLVRCSHDFTQFSQSLTTVLLPENTGAFSLHKSIELGQVDPSQKPNTHPSPFSQQREERKRRKVKRPIHQENKNSVGKEKAVCTNRAKRGIHSLPATGRRCPGSSWKAGSNIGLTWEDKQHEHKFILSFSFPWPFIAEHMSPFNLLVYSAYLGGGGMVQGESLYLHLHCCTKMARCLNTRWPHRLHPK